MRSTRACALVACVAAFGVACRKDRWPGLEAQPTSSGSTALAGTQNIPPPPPLPPRDTASWKHPRLLLSPERMRIVEAARAANTPSYQALMSSCNEAASGTMSGGYEGEDWAYKGLDLALCWRLNPGRLELARAAAKYMNALVDDYESIGDRRGGLRAVKGNDGYSIRNRAFLASMIFDWLYDSGEIDADVKKKIINHVYESLKWYRKEGYKRDDAISNHYMGHFGTAAAGGIAFDGEDPRGGEMRNLARTMWKTEVIPAFAKLAGGDFAEGWQYARTVGASIAIYVEAESRAPAGNPKIADELPWLRESVAFQTHALLPDGIHCQDNADWSRKPARQPSMFPMLTSVALPKGDPAGQRALWLGRKVRTDAIWNWADAIADDPNNQGEDPRKGPTSYLAKGTGTVLARTDWTDKAVFVSLTASPFYSDHQHLDQGHFEIVRGPDQLLIDPGDYDSYSTLSHNTIAVDDKKDVQRWPPSQGVWGKDVGVRRFQDDKGVVYALADFARSYDNDPDGDKKGHSVTRAEREFVFSRAPVPGMNASSARVVIYDRVTVAKPTYAVWWNGHASVTPRAAPGVTTFSLGGSQAIVNVLIPSGVTQRLLVEPTQKSSDAFTQNTPAEGIKSTRFETDSAKGSTERRFLHAIVVGAAGDPAPAVQKLEGEGVDGAAVADEAYVFPHAGPHKAVAGFSYRAPTGAVRHVVTGLAPNAGYAFSGAKEGAVCKITASGGGTKASQAGVVMLEVRDCAVR